MSSTRHDWDEKLGPYLDGELSAQEAGLVRAHLAGCAACRERLEQLTQDSRAIRALPREPMPADLKTAILSRKRAASPARQSMPWRLTSLAAAAVAVIVAATVWRTSGPLHAPERQVAELQRENPAGTAATDTAPPTATVEEDRRAAPMKELAKAEPNDKPQPRGRQRAAASDDSRRKDAVRPEATPSAVTPPAAPPAAGNVTARYAATLIVEDGSPARLTPIVPRSATDAGGVAPQGIPQDAAPTERSLSALSSAADASSSLITFLVKVDAEGRILSADPIGARTQNTTVVDLARSLLLGSRLVSFESGRAMAVVVEVSVPVF